jgi:hypothetical protein
LTDERAKPAQPTCGGALVHGKMPRAGIFSVLTGGRRGVTSQQV